MLWGTHKECTPLLERHRLAMDLLLEHLLEGRHHMVLLATDRHRLALGMRPRRWATDLLPIRGSREQVP